MICVISNNNNDNKYISKCTCIRACRRAYKPCTHGNNITILARESCKIVEAIPAATIIMHSLC